VHFIFWEFELSVAYVFIGEEFYFLEADDLGADENVSVGTRGIRGNRREIPRLRVPTRLLAGEGKSVGTLRSE
jgi:hypothetical protein